MSVSRPSCWNFFNTLNEHCRKTGFSGTFCLPSEAQWEYACRAGSETRWNFGNDEEWLKEYAWYDLTSSGRTHPVGKLRPNAWSLYDMHGNVWEWCEDFWTNNYHCAPSDGSAVLADTGEWNRVLRGGSCVSSAEDTRCAFRSGLTIPDDYLGFRLTYSLVPRDL